MSLLTATDIWAAPPGARDAVIRGVSLALSPGEWTAVSGPNGGGKTTLALALAGLRPIRSGRIVLEPAATNGRGRGALAVILQDPASQLFTGSVREELAYGARNLALAEDAIAESVAVWAARLGLDEDLVRDPRELSAGRQQLVLIGAALVGSPRVLIADEPGAHLDAATSARVLECVRREVSGGLAVLWLTQSAREIEAADRLIWLGEPARAERESRPVVPAADPYPDGAPAASVLVRPLGLAHGPVVRTAHAIEFTLPRRGAVALLGPNGVGKSVLLGALSGLIETEQIETRWRSEGAPPPLFVSQYPETQIFEERIEDELLYAALSRGVPRERALTEACAGLERLGLGALIGMRSWDLSSGERRMIEVLAGLIAPAGLLALDEPTAGLDPARREALSDLILERSKSGPVVIASHDPAWASGLGARTVTLGGDGRKSLPSLSKKTD